MKFLSGVFCAVLFFEEYVGMFIVKLIQWIVLTLIHQKQSLQDDL